MLAIGRPFLDFVKVVVVRMERIVGVLVHQSGTSSNLLLRVAALPARPVS
jgi:hypothetical protein